MPDEVENLPVPATPMEMVARAVNMGADPTTLERLLAMQERWERNEARKAFNQAIAKARGEISPIVKSAEVRMGAGRPAYKYETLDDIEREVVPALSKHGLSYRWGTKVPDARPDIIIVTCRIEHKDGHFEENSLAGPADTSGAKNPIQAIGSAVTYLCRYTLKAALGLSATKDDDGRGGGDQYTHNAKPQAQQDEPHGRPTTTAADITKQAVVRCADPRFQKFLEETNSAAWGFMNEGTPTERAAELVRSFCRVKSRRDIVPGSEAAQHWHDLDGRFQAWLRT